MRARCFLAADLAIRRMDCSVVDIALHASIMKPCGIKKWNGTYATFSTPMDCRALQWRVSLAQHFWTRRAARRNGFSSVAVMEFSTIHWFSDVIEMSISVAYR